ncbi:hypothetical protein L6452_04661 [Arctium lappa]|uniref:Uncharacterized protein n=1 Tax=Arctium lappa TaxID=4217 RepID=A0ACB9EEV3_ARCLA|nr:hypothetical protein L6452_04661 [Arctium lappa]
MSSEVAPTGGRTTADSTFGCPSSMSAINHSSTNVESIGETHSTNQVPPKSRYTLMPLTRNTPKARHTRRLSLRKFPEWRRSRHIPSQWRPILYPPSVLTWYCTSTARVLGDSAKGTLASHYREHPHTPTVQFRRVCLAIVTMSLSRWHYRETPPPLCTILAIVPDDSDNVTIAMALSRQAHPSPKT